MAITYKETGRRQEKWGIDVSVQFLDGEDIVQTTTFRFVNEKEIAHDFDNRCRRKVEGIEYDITNLPKPELSRNEVEEKLREFGHLAEDESFEDLRVAQARVIE